LAKVDEAARLLAVTQRVLRILELSDAEVEGARLAVEGAARELGVVIERELSASSAQSLTQATVDEPS
jgi:hypothetical protein